MGQYTSYYLYQKFEQRGSQEAIPAYPNVYSIDGDGTREMVIKLDNDPECGYDPPTPPIYKWVNIPITQDYICDDCPEYQTRWVRTDETTCVKEGPDPQYRWVNMDASTDYYCEGTTKYYKQKKQVSYDDGQTWQDVTPPEYQKGGVAEEQSTDCGYVPPTTKKLVATYSDGRTNEVECNDSSSLTTGETRPSGYERSAMTSAVIGNCVISIDINAFRNCSGLTSITIPDSLTGIGESAFNNCRSLTSINIPNSVTSISQYAFNNCRSLTSINIPNTIKYINDYVFLNCTSLTDIVIPNSVIGIEKSAFYGCSSLTSVVCNATTPPTLGSNVFYGSTCPILVPAQSVSTYKSASGWSQYASRIQAIP